MASLALRRFKIKYGYAVENRKAELEEYFDEFYVMAGSVVQAIELGDARGTDLGRRIESESKNASIAANRYVWLGGDVVSVSAIDGENEIELYHRDKLSDEPKVEEGVDDLYRNSRAVPEVVGIVININTEIKRYLAAHPEKLYGLSPRKFEELVADMLKDFGWDVELTPTTRDGGKDIYAYIRNQVCRILMFVECKKYSPERQVGIDAVQRLYGVQQSHKANKSMVVTTSFFTDPAIKEAKRYDALMDLRDYNDLKNWLSNYIES